jgi:hypothetical protein
MLTAVAIAGEPAAPKSLYRPMTAYATAKAEGKKTAITLKIVETATEIRMNKKVAYKDEEKVVNGKKVIERVPFEVAYTYQVEVPKGFREVKLTGIDVKARDTAGKAVTMKKLTEILATETPILLSTSADPVDPFHLLTTKAGTVILHVDPAKLDPPAKALPVEPKAVPPILE